MFVKSPTFAPCGELLQTYYLSCHSLSVSLSMYLPFVVTRWGTLSAQTPLEYPQSPELVCDFSIVAKKILL